MEPEETPIKFELIPISSSDYTKELDQLLAEIIITEIPFNYIEKLRIEYISGKVSEIYKDDIKKHLPIPKSTQRRISNHSKISKIFIYLDNEKLNYDIEFEAIEIINKIFNGKFS